MSKSRAYDLAMLNTRMAWIRWTDSAVYTEQCHPDDLAGFSVMQSCGFLVRDEEDSVTLAMDRCSGGRVRSAICVPRVNILDMIKYDLNDLPGDF